MSKTAIKAVFFDLGDTLGTAEVGGVPRRLLRFDLFPFSLGLLSELKARELKLGVISNTGSEKADTVNRVLEPTGILADLDPNLLLYSGEEGVTKASPEIFSRAARRAELEGTPDHCLFVGEDSSERSVALSAGWRVCPHPLLVKGMISEQSLFLHNAFAHSEVTMPISREFDIRSKAF